jgi:hypothetical protein
MVKGLAARPDVDVGSMKFEQANVYSWETMPSTAAYQLSQHPRVPEAMVFEPPGRIGTRRTIPEIDMTYGRMVSRSRRMIRRRFRRSSSDFFAALRG